MPRQSRIVAPEAVHHIINRGGQAAGSCRWMTGSDNGGWMAVKALRKAKVYMKGDERILCGSDFAEQVLVQAQEAY